MNKNRFVLAFILSAILKASTVQAAQEGHGGNIVDCDGKQAVVLDYYHATLPTLGNQAPALVNIANYSASQVIQLFKDRTAYRGYFAAAFAMALQRIGPVSNWLSADLKSVDDSNEPYVLPPQCNRKTAVIRQENVTMFGDPSVIKLLSPAQLGILQVHEAVYLIASDHSQNTSENVRTLVREVLRATTDQDALDRAMRGLGVSTANPTYILDNMVPGLYKAFVDVTTAEYEIASDLKSRVMTIKLTSTTTTTQIPSNLQKFEFQFDAAPFQGRELTHSGCDYQAHFSYSPTLSSSSMVVLTPNLPATECPTIFLSLKAAK